MEILVQEINAIKQKLLTVDLAFPQLVAIKANELLAELEKQQRQICELDLKCRYQEAIILNLIASISVADPDIFAILREHAEEGLTILPEQERGTDYAKLLESIIGIEKNPEPHLRLVKPSHAHAHEEPSSPE